MDSSICKALDTERVDSLYASPEHSMQQNGEAVEMAWSRDTGDGGDSLSPAGSPEECAILSAELFNQDESTSSL